MISVRQPGTFVRFVDRGTVSLRAAAQCISADLAFAQNSSPFWLKHAIKSPLKIT